MTQTATTGRPPIGRPGIGEDRGEAPLTTADRQLRSFVPVDAFDVHAHFCRRDELPGALSRDLADADQDVGWQAYDRSLQRWLGTRRPTAGLFFGYPHGPLDDVDAANRYVTEQTRDHQGSRSLCLIRPADDPAAVEATIEADGHAGFKVYHCYADCEDTFAARVPQFLPDWAGELADRRGLVIMLHIVRPRALADPVNQDDVRAFCRRYPGARLILAHAARGFCSAHTVAGIDSLRGLDNVFFDTSAICETPALEAILRVFGPTRLLFGTDFPVSEELGRCVSVGDGFLWLEPTNVAWNESAFARPCRVGQESLLALKQACRTRRLTDADCECIFGANARQLLGLPALAHPAGTHTAEISAEIFDEASARGARDRVAGHDERAPQDSGSGPALYRRARRLIPGGTQLLSKRPEMYAPDRWPAYYREARGCEVIDLDGRHLTDMTTSGIGACLLGYADPDVTDAVVRRVELGSMCTLNCADEVALAELLITLHPWAEQVRYCRTGGESMAVAVRIARACTGRDRVAFCGYHGWSDWYLAANLTGANGRDRDPLQGHLLPGLEPAGVPRSLAGTALPFAYNKPDQLGRIVDQQGAELAAVVMEPTRWIDPAPGFLESVRTQCDACGAVMVFDEITSGWRLGLGGAHLNYGVQPDLAVFAKALGNGHPIGAVIGRRRVMQAAEDSFISSTYWTEGVGLAAALATIGKLQRVDVPRHAAEVGQRFRAGLEELGRRHNVPVHVTGHPAILHIAFDHAEAAALGTLMTVRMLDRGFLTGGGFYPSLAHTCRHVDAYLGAADEVFAELALAIREGTIQQRIGGPVRHQGFARLTATR